jgi:hypothetical protein
MSSFVCWLICSREESRCRYCTQQRCVLANSDERRHTWASFPRHSRLRCFFWRPVMLERGRSWPYRHDDLQIRRFRGKIQAARWSSLHGGLVSLPCSMADEAAARDANVSIKPTSKAETLHEKWTPSGVQFSLYSQVVSFRQRRLPEVDSQMSRWWRKTTCFSYLLFRVVQIFKAFV